MNKLTKLGIVTFSAVTLSAVVPTLVHAEENVAPQPNAAARPTIQPTLTPKPNNNWVDYSMLDPIAKPKPKPGKEVSKPAEKPVEEPAPVEKPSTEGNILANGTDEAIAEDKKNAEIEKKYNVDPTNQLPEPGLPIITPEPEQPITDSEEMKKMVAEDLAYKAGAVMSMTKEENDKIVSEANQKLYALSGIDADKLLNTPIPGTNGQGFPTLADWTYREYEVQADFLDADRVQKYGYTTESRIDSPEHATVRSLRFDTDKDDADGILTAKKFSDYTFSHVVKATTDHPDIDPDPKVVRVSYDAAYALRGSGYKNGKGDNLFRYYFIYTKNKPVEEKPTTKDPQPAETEKPAEISKPAETVEPTVQPKPVEKKPVENKPAETPVPSPKPAENPQPEVKPVEQPQPAKPVEPAKNAGLQKIPYRTDQPKRWFNNGTGRPTLTTNDLAAPLPAENVEKTSYGWWTAEPDLLHAGSHIKVNTFNSNFNNPMFENGKEIKFEGSGFGDMDSRFKPALVRVKVPELEGMNYEAYTIFYEVPNKNGKPTYGTNRTLQGGGISLSIKSKEKKEDIQVYTLTKDKKLEELYYPGFPSEETNRYDEKTKTHSYNLFGETYDTYVFLFKNPAEKLAEQVKPEVKPSEQPKPDKQPSVPTVPADQPQPAKPEKPAEKPSEQPKPDKQPSVPTVPADQPHPTKPEKPAEKPSENPSASENPVNPANPAKPEVKPAEQPQENNIKSVRKWRLADGSFHEHPILTYADIVAPLPISDMKQTPINGIWTAEKDFVNNKPRLTLFWGSGNRYFEENGKEFSREELMKSTMYMYPIRVKIPELEGRNYEAYTIYTGILDGKTRKVELNKNTNITGEGYMVFRTKKEDNDVEVYQFSKNRQLAPLYSSRQLNERGRSVGEFSLSAEVYQTYVFLFKNPAEKPAEQVKPEVKPSEQPKPDKQPSVPTIPADQPQTTKPVEPAEKPSEQPVNPVTPVAPITPTTPVTPTLNPAIPNNTRVLSNKAGSVRVHGSEVTLKNVSYIKVEETKSTSLESKDYKAFDIHLYDANGKAIQPNGMVLVSLSADKPVENVYYVAPDGTLQALKFKQDTDKVTFETNHFSIYAMTFKVAASRDNGGSTTPVPVVNSSNTPTTTEQKGNDVNSTKTQAEPLATKTETISKQVAKTLPNTGENNSILATLFGMLTLTAGLFSFRKKSE
ncbi:LPXTG-motif cell wall anchor domain protein [Streptococcus mitis]|uniref:LPXTG-motif cell wall anchor domain protein n=1 Tax=Streptococcus mitis TaxID=28037 RepID=A0A081Q009_STRMT|nr:LPXTG cell wall anchor domain-containing protein [Streptococcus mitis]KEQ36282.1 LPXTG-motif cell wall anchor domain protein [Streptococcus mitis]